MFQDYTFVAVFLGFIVCTTGGRTLIVHSSAFLGRFGNQVEQYLGTLAFARGLNRTFVAPPFIIYPPEARGVSQRVPFKNVFQLKALNQVHRSITMEDFMAKLAPTIWPKGKRVGYCYDHSPGSDCSFKEGNPFGPFWDHFGVDFDRYEKYMIHSYDTEYAAARNAWLERFPPASHPVLALSGATGSFPMSPHHWPLQRALKWSSTVATKAKKFIKEKFDGVVYVGIHLRNGGDFENACDHVTAAGIDSYMASPQCTHGTDRKVTKKMCFPPESEVLRLTKKIVKKTKAKALFVATDHNDMIHQLTKHLKSLGVTIVKYPVQYSLHVEMAILQNADHFIGNCVSSVSSAVKRERDLRNKPTSYWGFS